MRYEREMDSEIFDEDEVLEAVDEMIEEEDLEEAMSHFDFLAIFDHLDEEMRLMIWEQARQTILEEDFMELEDEEEEE